MSLSLAEVSPEQIDLSSPLGCVEGFGKYYKDRVAEAIIRLGRLHGEWKPFKVDDLFKMFTRPDDPDVRRLRQNEIRRWVWTMARDGYLSEVSETFFVTERFVRRLKARIRPPEAVK